MLVIVVIKHSAHETEHKAQSDNDSSHFHDNPLFHTKTHLISTIKSVQLNLEDVIYATS